MTKEEYRKEAIKAFNLTWDYIDKKERTESEDQMMISLALKSREYWEKAGGTIINLVRGDWMISHTYSVMGDGKNALKYAEICLEKTLENDIKDFDLPFAYEAMAFAHKVLGNEEEKNKYLEEGYKHIDQIEKQGDKDYTKSQLDLLK